MVTWTPINRFDLSHFFSVVIFCIAVYNAYMLERWIWLEAIICALMLCLYCFFTLPLMIFFFCFSGIVFGHTMSSAQDPFYIVKNEIQDSVCQACYFFHWICYITYNALPPKILINLSSCVSISIKGPHYWVKSLWVDIFHYPNPIFIKLIESLKSSNYVSSFGS